MSPDTFRCSACGRPVLREGACFTCDDPEGEIADPAPIPRLSAVLLVERASTPGLWAAIRGAKHGGRVEVPGGKVEPGETPAEAAVREAQEELGVDLAGPLLYLGDFDHEHAGIPWRCSAFLLNSRVDVDLVGSTEGPAVWATREELVAGAHGEVIGRVFAVLDQRGAQ